MYSFFFLRHSLAASRFFSSRISLFLVTSGSPVPECPSPPDIPGELDAELTGRIVYA